MHFGKMLKCISYHKSQNLELTSLSHYLLAAWLLDLNGCTKPNMTMMVESPSIILVLLLTSWHWFLWDICTHWIGPNPHLHCIIVRLGIPSYWCWLLMLILHSSTTIYTMEKTPISNGPLYMLPNARRISFGFSFKHSMASNKLDTSGIKIGRHPNQNGIQSLVLESLCIYFP